MHLPEPTGLGEVVWLEPFPDALLPPDVRCEQTESLSLAFVTALQLLPPRQLAVLVLRDVLDFPAAEVAGMLDTTLDSVNSALKRARATLQRRRPTPDAPAPGSPAEEAIVTKFVRAYESADLDALVALLTDDVFMSMPPIPFEYQGRDTVAHFFAAVFAAAPRSLVPTRANNQPAFALSTHTPSGVRHATGLISLTLAGSSISALTRFEKNVLPSFGLPRSLPDQ
jgi:hypothetical protein